MASMFLAEYEKSSCHLQACVQCFEAEQRLTKDWRWIQITAFMVPVPPNLHSVL